MRLSINCWGCKHVLTGEVKIGGSPADLVRAFGWVFVPASTVYFCRDCAAAQRLVSTERRSA